jgi:hypothetical protein
LWHIVGNVLHRLARVWLTSEGMVSLLGTVSAGRSLIQRTVATQSVHVYKGLLGLTERGLWPAPSVAPCDRALVATAQVVNWGESLGVL